MRRRSETIVALAVLGAAAIGAVLLYLDHATERTRLALGSNFYAVHCASCHGARLEGQPDWQTPKPDGRLPAPPHDASGHTWHHSDEDLFRITKHGMSALVPGHASDMPAYVGILTDDEIRAILDFIKSTWPAQERNYQRLRSRSR